MPDLRPGPYRSTLKVLARLRARGPAEVASTAVARVRAAWSSDDVLVILARGAAGAPEAPAGDGFEFREATAADGAAYARDVGTDSPAGFRIRLTQATRCFVIERDGRIVHATWVTRRAAWTREVGAYLKPPPGDAYTYESFTAPEARGQGLYPHALGRMCAWLAPRGVGRVWVGVERGNAPSLRAVAKAGFEPVCELAFGRRRGRLRVDAPSGPRAGECAGLLADRP